MYEPIAVYLLNQSAGDFRYCYLKVWVWDYYFFKNELSWLRLQWKYLKFSNGNTYFLPEQIYQFIKKPQMALKPYTFIGITSFRRAQLRIEKCHKKVKFWKNPNAMLLRHYCQQYPAINALLFTKAGTGEL